MTKYYLWYFPDARKCVVKSIGLHSPHTVIYQKEDEPDDVFRGRAMGEFDGLFNSWLDQVAPDFRRSEILSTKTLQ